MGALVRHSGFAKAPGKGMVHACSKVVEPRKSGTSPEKIPQVVARQEAKGRFAIA